MVDRRPWPRPDRGPAREFFPVQAPRRPPVSRRVFVRGAQIQTLGSPPFRRKSPEDACDAWTSPHAASTAWGRPRESSTFDGGGLLRVSDRPVAAEDASGIGRRLDLAQSGASRRGEGGAELGLRAEEVEQRSPAALLGQRRAHIGEGSLDRFRHAGCHRNPEAEDGVLLPDRAVGPVLGGWPGRGRRRGDGSGPPPRGCRRPPAASTSRSSVASSRVGAARSTPASAWGSPVRRQSRRAGRAGPWRRVETCAGSWRSRPSSRSASVSEPRNVMSTATNERPRRAREAPASAGTGTGAPTG